MHGANEPHRPPRRVRRRRLLHLVEDDPPKGEVLERRRASVRVRLSRAQPQAGAALAAALKEAVDVDQLLHQHLVRREHDVCLREPLDLTCDSRGVAGRRASRKADHLQAGRVPRELLLPLSLDDGRAADQSRAALACLRTERPLRLQRRLRLLHLRPQIVATVAGDERGAHNRLASALLVAENAAVDAVQSSLTSNHPLERLQLVVVELQVGSEAGVGRLSGGRQGGTIVDGVKKVGRDERALARRDERAPARRGAGELAAA
mmetsp:Transcript_10261/g.32504  ORF Transcript_10261/g.32504 Transcript_10261/m.32504 type:complete len:263 (-) Transcript_10261:35-823(-)